MYHPISHAQPLFTYTRLTSIIRTNTHAVDTYIRFPMHFLFTYTHIFSWVSRILARTREGPYKFWSQKSHPHSSSGHFNNIDSTEIAPALEPQPLLWQAQFRQSQVRHPGFWQVQFMQPKCCQAQLWVATALRTIVPPFLHPYFAGDEIMYPGLNGCATGITTSTHALLPPYCTARICKHCQPWHDILQQLGLMSELPAFPLAGCLPLLPVTQLLGNLICSQPVLQAIVPEASDCAECGVQLVVLGLVPGGACSDHVQLLVGKLSTEPIFIQVIFRPRRSCRIKYRLLHRGFVCLRDFLHNSRECTDQSGKVCYKIESWWVWGLCIDRFQNKQRIFPGCTPRFRSHHDVLLLSLIHIWRCRRRG